MENLFHTHLPPQWGILDSLLEVNGSVSLLNLNSYKTIKSILIYRPHNLPHSLAECFYFSSEDSNQV